ncbi:GH1 family beta-glucosidase [Hymenobacter sp. 5317J-9]|uniref:GH1 family beta-glucosidase n=1 Tax=Hymenobacter sp. 5317J-9 TaxID=2932250 RepID=UPI001FD67455|nr:GH1 family beta-glucosidase [Hymenobacter sp. 5317J-9]UOQ96097.1 GH1 family beta-glucosidase [Hymenobacter sp. 5317J-9]
MLHLPPRYAEPLPPAFYPPSAPLPFSRADFGTDFSWGASAAAYQTEGAWQHQGKGPSIWDDFTRRKGAIRRNEHARVATDFYNRYETDLDLARGLGLSDFRFSAAWSRVLPAGTGAVSRRGLDFYDRLVDACLARDLRPWLTLYHWDLPSALQARGGWANRDVVGWFADYAQLMGRCLGDRVGHWAVLNEPMVFVGAGHLLGIHAPGRRHLGAFLAAAHHATLAQAEGGRALRAVLPEAAQIGTTFSCSYLTPHRPGNAYDEAATRRADAVLNRFFVEPALGLGYPLAELPALRWLLERYHKPGDERRMAFDFDFWGIQNYTREVVKFSPWLPLQWAALVPAKQRGVPYTDMGWEVYPESVYQMLKQFGAYPNAPKLLITESGSAFPDVATGGRVHDEARRAYLQAAIGQVLRARQEGVNVAGYFAWSLTDNFEWAEGYGPRFGLIHVDYETQERIVKDSGRWYRDFLSGAMVGAEQVREAALRQQ